jgi:hypothetical protein
MSFGKYPTIFTPISTPIPHGPAAGSNREKLQFRYQRLMNRNPVQHKNRPFSYDEHYNDVPTPQSTQSDNITPNLGSNFESALPLSQPVTAKPPHVKRLSIDTLINDSDIDDISQSAASSMFISNQDSVRSVTLITPEDYEAWINRSIDFLNGIKKVINTPQGFDIGCSIVSEWLQGVRYRCRVALIDALVDLLNV